MAELLVYIEMDGDRPSGASLAVLGLGRRIASSLGAVVYAALPCLPGTDLDRGILEALSRRGADKVLVLEGPRHAGEAQWSTRGAALASAWAWVRPRLMLLAATGAGRDIAPRLAARMSAAYFPMATVTHGAGGTFVSRFVYQRSYQRRMALESFSGALVATVAPRPSMLVNAEEEAEVLSVPITDDPAALVLEELGSRLDPGAGLENAEVIVTLGADASAESVRAASTLAERLGGRFAVSAGACADGHAPSEIVAGASRPLAPRLFISSPGGLEVLTSSDPLATVVVVGTSGARQEVQDARYTLVGDVTRGLESLAAAADRGSSR